MPSNHDLDALAEVAKETGFPGFARYCDLRARGLRNEAMLSLRCFLDEAKDEPFAYRQAFVLTLTKCREAFSDPRLLCPEPFVTRLALPTLNEWIERDPDAAMAYFLLGTYSLDAASPDRRSPIECFRKAIACDLRHQDARFALADIVLRWVDYAQHELPYGYIGSAEEDVVALREALGVLLGVDITPRRAEAERRLRDMLGQAEQYLARRGRSA